MLKRAAENQVNSDENISGGPGFSFIASLLTHGVSYRSNMRISQKCTCGTAVCNGFTRTQEKTSAKGASEGNHLHVTLLHVSLDAVHLTVSAMLIG